MGKPCFTMISRKCSQTPHLRALRATSIQTIADRLRPLQNGTLCPISASGSNFNPRNIQYIPVVEIFAFLELEHKLPFFKGLRLITHICSTCERLQDGDCAAFHFGSKVRLAAMKVGICLSMCKRLFRCCQILFLNLFLQAGWV